MNWWMIDHNFVLFIMKTQNSFKDMFVLISKYHSFVKIIILNVQYENPTCLYNVIYFLF
jgi:hypothetical protein